MRVESGRGNISPGPARRCVRASERIWRPASEVAARLTNHRLACGSFCLILTGRALRTRSWLDSGACQCAPAVPPSGFHQTESDDREETERGEYEQPGLVGTCDLL